jgi:hypothetical protein
MAFLFVLKIDSKCSKVSFYCMFTWNGPTKHHLIMENYTKVRDTLAVLENNTFCYFKTTADLVIIW